MDNSSTTLVKLFKILLFLSLLGILMLYGCGSGAGSQKLSFQTEYQAVFLDNGQVYFGKADVGRDYVTLSDVFYVVSRTNQKTKEVKNGLIKRGKEWHGPDLMQINKSHVVFIEPVSPDSQVARLIKEAKTERQPETN